MVFNYEIVARVTRTSTFENAVAYSHHAHIDANF